jgi:membrane-associated protease RseP (regulator of RpoE activity)
MTIPEIEILTSLISRIFRIDDVTAGDPRQYIVRYRGQLISEDSAAAYDQLSAAVEPFGIIPMFRIEDGRQIILLVTRPPDPKPARVSINIILFILTVFSVMLAGAQPDGPLPPDTLGQILALARNIFSGWPFALSLLGILLAHEFGHYFASRYHKTPATLPYFIPFPFSPLGTMGAAILMQGTPKNKRVLFDIGVAGPLAGLIVAIPVIWLGLSLSKVGPVKDFVYPAPQPGEQAYCSTPSYLPDGRYSCAGDNFVEGNSLIYLGMKYLRFGELLPSPANLNGQSLIVYWLKYFFTGQPLPIGGRDVMIDPVAFAGWAGLLVTALNLLPAGTLDGGHVVYALFGDKAKKAFPFILLFLALFGFFWSGWWLWAVILLWLGRVQAQPLDQITTLDPPRRTLALVVLILFILVFIPVPFVTF